MPLAPRQRHLAATVSPPCDLGRKLGAWATALRWPGLHEEPTCPSRVLLATVAQTPSPMVGSIRQRKRWRVPWPRNRRQGRPRQATGRRPGSARPEGAEGVALRPQLAFVGGHLLAHGLDPQATWRPAVARLPQALEADQRAPPHDDFAR
jgi:hypothetical protein